MMSSHEKHKYKLSLVSFEISALNKNMLNIKDLWTSYVITV